MPHIGDEKRGDTPIRIKLKLCHARLCSRGMKCHGGVGQHLFFRRQPS